MYDVVLHGTAYGVQVFYPEMVKRKTGHIVFVGSQAGMVPNWFTLHGPYTSAKSAVMALGAALRPEAEEHNVGVTNVIVAGTVTEIMKSERSRPSEYGDPLVYNMPKRTARRIPASDTAGMIVSGIEENKPWVATHPELKELTRYRLPLATQTFQDTDGITASISIAFLLAMIIEIYRSTARRKRIKAHAFSGITRLSTLSCTTTVVFQYAGPEISCWTLENH